MVSFNFVKYITIDTPRTYVQNFVSLNISSLH